MSKQRKLKNFQAHQEENDYLNNEILWDFVSEK